MAVNNANYKIKNNINKFLLFVNSNIYYYAI
jgi:hypothetical protein